MAITSVSICNTALAQLGANLINSFTEGTVEATLCNTFWEQTRLTNLVKHPWNFAIERVELAQNATPPTFHYSYSYNLPTPCLRVLQVYENDDYKIEGRKILTNRKNCYLKYIKDVSDVSIWSRGFVHVMTAAMRAQLAYPITKNSQEVQLAEQLLENAWTEAKFIDASEDIEDPFGFGSNTLIEARF